MNDNPSSIHYNHNKDLESKRRECIKNQLPNRVEEILNLPLLDDHGIKRHDVHTVLYSSQWFHFSSLELSSRNFK